MFATQTPTLDSLVRKAVIRWFYNLVARLDRDRLITFMNYGYISLDPNAKLIPLKAEEEKFRYEIQLYHHIASAIDWTGKDGLEVGSGRGGGAAYIKQRFHPKSMTGLDLSEKAVAFCSQHHAPVGGLRFVQGDAESIQFPDESFDVIVNVESSMYYPDFKAFLANVVRLLRPNGYFLYSDMRYAKEIPAWREQLMNMGLALVSEEDISLNTKKAVVLMQEPRKKLADHYVPAIIRPFFHTYSGADGRRLLNGSKKLGERLYFNFVFRKTRA